MHALAERRCLNATAAWYAHRAPIPEEEPLEPLPGEEPGPDEEEPPPHPDPSAREKPAPPKRTSSLLASY